jgi:hypothetical protein
MGLQALYQRREGPGAVGGAGIFVVTSKEWNMKQLTQGQLALVSGGGVIVAGEGSGGGVVSGVPAALIGTGASVTAIGAAIGADAAVGTAGGLGALGGVTNSIAAGTAIAGGYLGAGYLGYVAGTILYNNSETVQGVAQNMVERFMEGPIDAVVTGVSDIWDMITGQGSYAPPATGASPTANSQNTLVVPH